MADRYKNFLELAKKETQGIDFRVRLQPSDLDKTEANKALMDLLAGRRETFTSYFNGTQYVQHNPWAADTIPGLIAGLQALAAKGQAVLYKRVHKILGEGNFVRRADPKSSVLPVHAGWLASNENSQSVQSAPRLG